MGMEHQQSHTDKVKQEYSKNTYNKTNQMHYFLKKLYDIYRCCVYTEKLLLMDRWTVRNM